jgi:NADH:ubiquinone oxidoreductase subunit D
MEAVLEEIGISEADIIAAGLHEQAEEIIRSENEEANRIVAHILELAPKALKDGATGLGFYNIRPLVTPDGIKERIEKTWERAQIQAKKHILKLLHGGE